MEENLKIESIRWLAQAEKEIKVAILLMIKVKLKKTIAKCEKIIKLVKKKIEKFKI